MKLSELKAGDEVAVSAYSYHGDGKPQLLRIEKIVKVTPKRIALARDQYDREEGQHRGKRRG